MEIDRQFIERASMTTVHRDMGRLAGGAGAFAATVAALCCAGAPILVGILAAAGLGFLRSDAILLPVTGVALAVALWGIWHSRRAHGSYGPLSLGAMGSVALVAGVVFLHGPLAKLFIGAGTLLLLGATIWNARLPACAVLVPLTHHDE